MFNLESDKITGFWPNDSLTFTFYAIIPNSILNWATFVKEVFDSMFSLECDKMTALWQNDSLTFTLYATFSFSITNWTTFVKEVFWFDVQYRKWRNDFFLTKWQLNFNFLCVILKKHSKLSISNKRNFLIQCLVSRVTN